MSETREARARRKENNPTARLSPRIRRFLMAYVGGSDPYTLVENIWPAEKSPPLKVAKMLRDEKFQEAFRYLTEDQLTRHALAYRQLIVAGECEKPIDKVHAIRAASQILGHIRNGDSESSKPAGKTQKNKIPVPPKSELENKMDELLRKAEYGHQKPQA